MNEPILMSLCFEQTPPEDYVSRFLVDDPLGYTRKFDSGSMFGDFSSTGSVDTDSFASVQDSDPVFRTYNNFTINAGHTVTTTNRCKGLYLNILGDLVVNGTLSMTARGAAAAGQYVAIDKSSKRVYYFNDAPTDELTTDLNRFFIISKNGGTPVTPPKVVNYDPTIANNYACGVGGGTGGNSTLTGYSTAKGGMSTSFSGGAGAGGGTDYHIDGQSYEYFGVGGVGAANGGAGGNGKNGIHAIPSYGGGGGAGNPGGLCQVAARNGASGTGGLMILFVQGNIIFGLSGSIQANGSKGGDGYYAAGRYAAWPGAGSGGGAIHIFHKRLISDVSKITATGGQPGFTPYPDVNKIGSCVLSGNRYKIAQPGGNGTVNIVQV